MSAPRPHGVALCHAIGRRQRCMLHCDRVRGVCTILLLVNCLQKEHPT